MTRWSQDGPGAAVRPPCGRRHRGCRGRWPGAGRARRRDRPRCCPRQAPTAAAGNGVVTRRLPTRRSHRDGRRGRRGRRRRVHGSRRRGIRPGWWRPAAGTYKAFTAVCTHQGCTVAFAKKSEQFQCPCHGGIYDAQDRRGAERAAAGAARRHRGQERRRRDPAGLTSLIRFPTACGATLAGHFAAASTQGGERARDGAERAARRPARGPRRWNPDERIVLPLLAIAAGAHGIVGHSLGNAKLQQWSTIFVAITVQALPFLVLGVLVSGAVSTMVSPRLLAKVLGRRSLVSVPMAALGRLRPARLRVRVRPGGRPADPARASRVGGARLHAGGPGDQPGRAGGDGRGVPRQPGDGGGPVRRLADRGGRDGADLVPAGSPRAPCCGSRSQIPEEGGGVWALAGVARVDFLHAAGWLVVGAAAAASLQVFIPKVWLDAIATHKLIALPVHGAVRRRAVDLLGGRRLRRRQPAPVLPHLAAGVPRGRPGHRPQARRHAVGHVRPAVRDPVRADHVRRRRDLRGPRRRGGCCEPADRVVAARGDGRCARSCWPRTAVPSSSSGPPWSPTCSPRAVCCCCSRWRRRCAAAPSRTAKPRRRSTPSTTTSTRGARPGWFWRRCWCCWWWRRARWAPLQRPAPQRAVEPQSRHLPAGRPQGQRGGADDAGGVHLASHRRRRPTR